jgi:electron transport complex protein RnfD
MSDNATLGGSTASVKKTAGSVLLLQSSPHIVSPVNSAALMRNMLIALAPVSIFGAAIFGLPALLNMLVSVLAAIAAEVLFRLATGQRPRTADLSAGVTGLLLALVIPPSMPLWMTALGAIFGVIAAKEFFGGLGANVFNPALAGRAFLMMSFPAAMTTWNLPCQGFVKSLADAVSGATPLAYLKTGEVVDALTQASIAVPSKLSLFLGLRGGCTGETSIALILAGGIFLLITKTIDWRAPAGMLAAAVLAGALLGYGPVTTLLTGGLVFGAVFMATDYVTTPLTARGKLIFGIGAGIISVLIRKWGTYPEGVSYSILIMNAAVPFLNRLLPKKYGFVPPPKNAASPAGSEKGGAK